MTRGDVMKAFVLRSYGSPDALELAEVDRPVPFDDEVLVRVRATSVQPYDWHFMRGEPYIARLMSGDLGLRTPRMRVLGADVAGRVEAVGKDVTRFTPGEEVFGMPKRGCFAEYVCVRESELAPKPGTLSFERAAAVPMAACTALLALRDLPPGRRVLVNGASGGVGTFAVQIAKAYGAEVTAVCGTRNTGLVLSIGADAVIDYTKEDFTLRERRYDFLVDVAGNRPGAASRRVLTAGGTYAAVGGPAGRWLRPAGRMISTLTVSPFVSQRVIVPDVVRCPGIGRHLATLTGLIEAGQVTPVIDRAYPFEEIPEAVGYQEAGHASGKVVISV
jgi:NADPH:quinone reductase-like Zn-dependent oxidoreductase